jgi:hypothetical protein
VIKMLTELIREISEFIADFLRTGIWRPELDTSSEKGVKTQQFMRQKYFRNVTMKRLGGGSITDH